MRLDMEYISRPLIPMIHARRKRRVSTLQAMAITALVVFQVVVGGMSGLLLGAIILNAIEPGHPFYLALQVFLRRLFGCTA